MITALAMFLVPRMNKQQKELERMTRVIGAHDRLGEVLPDQETGKQPELEPYVLEGSDIENSVRFDVTGLPEGAKVLLDGKPLPQVPILIEATDQPHAMRIEAPGHLPYETDVLIKRDTAIEVTMEPTSAGPQVTDASWASRSKNQEQNGLSASVRAGRPFPCVHCAWPDPLSR